MKIHISSRLNEALARGGKRREREREAEKARAREERRLEHLERMARIEPLREEADRFVNTHVEFLLEELGYRCDARIAIDASLFVGFEALTVEALIDGIVRAFGGSWSLGTPMCDVQVESDLNDEGALPTVHLFPMRCVDVPTPLYLRI